MRLRDAHVILQRNTKSLAVELTGTGQNGRIEITGRAEARAALEQIARIPALSKQARRASEFRALTQDSSIASDQDANAVRKALERLKAECGDIERFLAKSLSPEPEHYFSTRLPDELSVSQLAKLARSVEIAIERPLAHFRFGGARVRVDLGSNWLELIVESPQAVVFLGMLLSQGLVGAKLAAEFAKTKQESEKAQQEKEKRKQEVEGTKQEVEKTKQEVEKTKQEAQRTEQERYRTEQARLETQLKVLQAEAAYAEAARARHEAATDAAILEFARERSVDSDAENVARTAVKEIEDLLTMGVEFSAPENAQPSIAVAFPNAALPNAAVTPLLVESTSEEEPKD